MVTVSFESFSSHLFLSFNRLSSRRMASEKSEFERVVITNRNYRKTTEKYNRNVKQSVRGFYTPAHVPYASIGDVCLDVKDLVVKTVGGERSQEKVG